MSNTEYNLRSKIASSLMSVFVFATFLAGVVTTAVWMKNVAFGPNDPRKTTKVAAMYQRPIDTTGRPYLFSEPIITVTFDDGWESTYTKALPILQKYGIPTTQYIIAGELSNQVYMSEGQIKSMQKHGHEVASHTMTHPDLTSLTSTQLDYELNQSKKVLTKDFGPIYDFAAPEGAKNDKTIATASKSYRSQKNTEGDPNTLDDHGLNIESKFKMDNVKGYTVRSTTTQQELKEMLEYATQHNGWIVLTYHQIDDSGELFSVSPAVFEKQMAMISKYRIRTATMNQVLSPYMEMQ